MDCLPYTAWPSLRSPGHPLHAYWWRLRGELLAAQRLPTAEDCERAAAQLLMETWLRGYARVEAVQVDVDGHLHARCPRPPRLPRRVWLDARQAVAWRVEETSRALAEALAAAPPGWPLPPLPPGPRQRRLVSGWRCGRCSC